MTTPSKPRRGFAALPPDRRREIARAGGAASTKSPKAHRFNSESGRAAGLVGGSVTARDREHMARIGRIGGLRRPGRSA